jgi:hypothetical protein
VAKPTIPPPMIATLTREGIVYRYSRKMPPR